MNKKFFLVVASLMFTAFASASFAVERPSCDAPLAKKLLAGGCNSKVGDEHEFTPRFDRNQPDYVSPEPAEETPAEPTEPSEPSEPGHEGPGDSDGPGSGGPSPS